MTTAPSTSTTDPPKSKPPKEKPLGRKILFWVSFLLAMGLLALGLSGWYFTQQSDDFKQTLQQVQQSTSTADRESRIDEATYDNTIGFATGAELAEAKQHYQESIAQYAIGSLYIPKAEIKQPILAGTSDYNLFNGVATASQDQRLGNGLWVGLAHNMLTDNLLLDPIQDVQPNDEIYATDFDTVYVYRVLEQEVVHETDGEYLDPSKAESVPKMVLYRCEGEAGTEWRRVVYAEYVTSYPLSYASDDVQQGLGLAINHEAEAPKPVETVEASETISEKLMSGFKIAALNTYAFVDSHLLLFVVTILILLGISAFA